MTEELLNGNEIGYLHGNRLFNLHMPKSKRDRWVEEGKGRQGMCPDSGRVSINLNSERHVVHAIEITRSKYDQITF